jgi:hypothetical protein
MLYKELEAVVNEINAQSGLKCKTSYTARVISRSDKGDQLQLQVGYGPRTFTATCPLCGLDTSFGGSTVQEVVDHTVGLGIKGNPRYGYFAYLDLVASHEGRRESMYLTKQLSLSIFMASCKGHCHEARYHRQDL